MRDRNEMEMPVAAHTDEAGSQKGIHYRTSVGSDHGVQPAVSA
jgi:hypothetical protein